MSTLDVKYVPDSCSFGLEIFKENPDLGVWLYKYDQNGNLIFQSGGGGNLVTGDGYYREYDDFGQLVRVRNGSSVSSALLEEYVYDHSGQRIKIKRNDSANTTVYTPFRELMRVVNSTGSYDFTYVYDGNTLVARINPDGSKQYEHTDHLGSTSVITNQNGNVVENTSYTPYGEELSGGNLDVKGYTGQFDDEATGQMYYGARYYKPGTAQFVQGDPVLQNPYDPQFLNHYAYVRNNPYKLMDPDGRVVVIFQGGPSGDSVDPKSGVQQIYDQLPPDVQSASRVFAPSEGAQEGYDLVQNQRADNPNQPVVIIGHSWGGGDALELQEKLEGEGIAVDLVYTIDPYSIYKKHGELFWKDDYNPSVNVNIYQDDGPFYGKTLTGATNEQFHGNSLWTHFIMDSNSALQGRIISRTVSLSQNYRYSSHGGKPRVSDLNGGKRTVSLGYGGAYGGFRCYASSCSRSSK